ncbi:MAG: hypothetical protein N2112_11070 [Gemmataceae bacterium]|jgi:hypothetical protein|nr:hypothetical protein [Gemmataceae bacterium]
MMPEHPIDRLVRHDAEARAARVDAQALLLRVRQKLDSSTRSPAPSRSRSLVVKTLGWGLATALTIAATILVGWFLPSDTAQAKTELLVHEVEVAYAETPIDRCYEIETQWETEFKGRYPWLLAPKKARLWTRGDRFLLELDQPDGRKFTYGRDEAGNLWFAPNKKIGFIFRADETGEGITRIAELYSMQMDSLLKDLQTGYQLRQEPISDPPNRVKIFANRRGQNPNPGLRFISLQLEKKSKTIELLEIRRKMQSGEVHTVSYKHTEDRQLPDQRYQLAGQLDPDARIFGPEHSQIRSLWLKRLMDRKPTSTPEKQPLPKKATGT